MSRLGRGLLEQACERSFFRIFSAASSCNIWRGVQFEEYRVTEKKRVQKLAKITTKELFIQLGHEVFALHGRVSSTCGILVQLPVESNLGMQKPLWSAGNKKNTLSLGLPAMVSTPDPGLHPTVATVAQRFLLNIYCKRSDKCLTSLIDPGVGLQALGLWLQASFWQRSQPMWTGITHHLHRSLKLFMLFCYR